MASNFPGLAVFVETGLPATLGAGFFCEVVLGADALDAIRKEGFKEVLLTRRVDGADFLILQVFLWAWSNLFHYP